MKLDGDEIGMTLLLIIIFALFAALVYGYLEYTDSMDAKEDYNFTGYNQTSTLIFKKEKARFYIDCSEIEFFIDVDNETINLTGEEFCRRLLR